MALNRDVVLTGKKKQSSHDIVSPPVEAGNQSDIVSSSSGKEKQCETVPLLAQGKIQRTWSDVVSGEMPLSPQTC
ncbi:unnamed protein product [Linum trigynum]|uniref:Uncharacterized protein n=1 Tax=Linum trigynum TaxID=586398 RepID=A0AAV2CB16_9ROSI